MATFVVEITIVGERFERHVAQSGIKPTDESIGPIYHFTMIELEPRGVMVHERIDIGGKSIALIFIYSQNSVAKVANVVLIYPMVYHPFYDKFLSGNLWKGVLARHLCLVYKRQFSTRR